MYCTSCGHQNEDGARRCVSCGAELDQGAGGGGPADGAEMFGPYELRGELGRGAMARVWRAWDPHLRREVAIKEPLFDPRLSPEVLDEMGRRFVAEGVAAARLNHPNIVTIYSADVYDGRPAIVMELVEGATLSGLLEAGPLEPNTAVDALDQLLDAAAYAHSMGVVHRDIKPDNVFVGADGRVRLADFGIARMDDADATRATVAGAVLGTPGYMSPEQIRGDVVDARSDLFSIGVVAYEMLSGKNPFGAGEGADVTTLVYRVVNEPAPELPEPAASALPPSVAPAIMAALAKDPANRPQTADEFKAMLHGTATVPITPPLPASSGLASAAQEAQETHSGAPKWLPYVLVGAVCVVALALVLLNGLSTQAGGASGAATPTATAASAASASSAAAPAASTSASSTSAASSSAKAISDNDASEREQVSQQTSNAPSSFPHKWTGTYVGRSDHTASGNVDRYVDMEFTEVLSDGKVKGVCYVGRGQQGYSHSSYNIEGTISWDLGTIEVEGTSWIDHGDMETWGGFRGSINMSDWTIDGEWYAPQRPDAGTSPWSMSAGTRRIASEHAERTEAHAHAGAVSGESGTTSGGGAPSAYSQNSLIPQYWMGTYEGVSDHTDSGTVQRKVEMNLDPVVPNKPVTGECFVGRGQSGYAHCSYKVTGEYDRNTGHIRLEGSEWIDKGTMESWGGFDGQIYPDGSITGEWYDPTGVSSHRGKWYMMIST